jgi:hypothetical protein
MPLSINVGLSRKASRNYQSTGVSINFTAELDQSLLAKPQDLQAEIAHLYAQAESAMVQQANGMAQSNPRPVRSNGSNGRSQSDRGYANGGRRTNGNGNANGNGHGNGGGMTASQRRAILAIADRVGIDAGQEARDVIGSELDNLSVRQASQLIDHLKAIQPPWTR